MLTKTSVSVTEKRLLMILVILLIASLVALVWVEVNRAKQKLPAEVEIDVHDDVDPDAQI